MKSAILPGGVRSKEQLLQKFFRFGLVSKGVVYCLLGILTTMAAVGLGKDNASKKDAFNFLYEQPFGKILLLLIAIGLFGFVMLRIFQTVKDTEDHGSDAKGLVTRAGYGISALVYLSLGIYAIKLLVSSADGGGDARQFVVSKILQFDKGEWIIGIAGIVVMISGGYQIFKGATQKFMKKINGATSRFIDVFRKAGIVGHISRGVVLLIIGYFLLRAAIDSNASQVQDTDGAFDFLENQFGSFVMGVIALGLTAYGVFMFVKAKYERMSVKLSDS